MKTMTKSNKKIFFIRISIKLSITKIYNATKIPNNHKLKKAIHMDCLYFKYHDTQSHFTF